MVGQDPNRQPRLGSLRQTPAGWVGVAACSSCSHKGPLPIDHLIRKHGELAIVEVVGLRCTACHGYGAGVLMLKLCEPGCPRQR